MVDVGRAHAPQSRETPWVNVGHLAVPDCSFANILVVHGAQVFYGYLALYCIIAFLSPLIGFATLPRDTVEGFLWGRSLQWGYYKHPPLQVWVLGFSEVLAPDAPWLAYLYAQICVAIALIAVFELANDILGRARAVVASILTMAGVHYFGAPMATFTPDTLSLPLWSLTGLFWWRAAMAKKPRYWLRLSFIVALSVYAKYVGLLLVGILAVLTLLTPSVRRELFRKEFVFAVIVGLLLVTPHAMWLLDTGSSALAHAVSYETQATTMVMRIWFCLKFLGAQLVAHAGLFFLIVFFIRTPVIGDAKALRIDGPSIDSEAKAVLIAMALLPLAIAIAINFAVGGEFRQGRGTALFAFSGIAVVVLLGPVLLVIREKVAIIVALLLSAGLPIANAAHHHIRLHLGSSHVPTLYPAKELAIALETRWREYTKLPLKIVVGDRWHGGNVAFYATDKPLLMVNGDLFISPGLEAGSMARDGALVVWDARDEHALPRLRVRLPQLMPQGLVSRPYATTWSTSEVQIAYAIVLPETPLGAIQMAR